jgi:hypothetical protein
MRELIAVGHMNVKRSFPVSCLLISLCQHAHADIGIDVLCLSTTGAKPINMEMRLYFDRNAKWTTGFVKYQNSSKPIPIVLKNSVQEMSSETAPYEHTDSWIETADGKISGMYEITMQGTQIPSATYENYSNKKKFFFLLNNNIEGTPEAGCAWQ